MKKYKFLATMLVLTFMLACVSGIYAGTWTTYNNSNTGGAIGNNTIKGAGVDSANVKWFCTNGGGVAKFTGTSWQKYGSSQGLANNTVRAVACDTSGNKWFATAGGASKYNGTTWVKYTTGNSALASNNCYSITAADTTVWVGTYDRGACRLVGTSWTTYNTTNSSLTSLRVNGAAAETSGTVWLATMDGVDRFTGTSWTHYKNQLASDDVFAVTVAPNNDKWFGTLSGVSRYNNTTWTTYTTSQGLAKNDTLSIAASPDGTIWAGSNGSGISKFTGATPWTVYSTSNSGLVNNYGNAVAAESSTLVYFGTNLGVSKYDYGTPPVPPPVAAFIGTPTSGSVPLSVGFTDQSTNTPTAWSWTFGDSGTSTAQNPSHQYTATGTYTVSLTASNAGGSDNETKTGYITVTNPPPPVPDFDASPRSGLAPLLVAFTDRSTGNIDTWKYDFDGNGSDDWSDSSSGNAEWTYLNAGVFTVSLRVRDAVTGSYYTNTKLNYISVTAPTPPTAAFTASKTSGSLPMTVLFTDQTTGDSINSWSWTFGDSGTSTAQSPSHVYDTEGTYTVSLTASSPYGTDTETKVDYITVGPAQACDANLAGNPTAGFSPLSVQFTDTSTGSITSWSWTFGDSGTSTDANPQHTYGSGVFTVSLAVTGPLNSDSITKTDYITVQTAPPGGSGFAFADSSDDLNNLHPHLWCKGYGTENGLWAKAQSTHSGIWARITANAPTGATYGSAPASWYSWGGYPVTRTLSATQQSAMAYVISKIAGYGQYAQDEVLTLNGCNFVSGGGDADLACMETFWGYCMAYDAIVDDQLHGGPTWLNSSQKAAALATMADYLVDLNFDPGDTWRVRPTHNFMVARAANHTVALYNLRGEAGYETLYNTSRPFNLTYHNERINGLCDHGVEWTTAPLTNEGPRPADGFPYEGPSYGAYQGSRALVHRHIMELNEYPNPATILDENKSGFALNFCLGWMAVSPPGLDMWTDVAYVGDHGITQAFRYYSAIDKAVGVSDKTVIPAAKMARVGEWFTRQVIPSPKGSPDNGWWQGFELAWYDASILPMTPAEAGLPLYLHLDDAEFHMYRDSWDIYPYNPDDTYVYFRNSGHDGHNYWNELHAGASVPYNCTAQTSSHDGADNGHFGIYKNRGWIAKNNGPADNSDQHNVLLIDGLGNLMDDKRGYQVPELATADCIGAVDSDYGHALEGILGGVYGQVTNYSRFVFTIRNNMYVLIADELDSGHTSDFRCWMDSPANKQSEGLFTNSSARYEVMYPSSGYTSSAGTAPLDITTSSNRILVLVHPNPSGVSVSKSYPGTVVSMTIGSDTVVYNPGDGGYSTGGISGDAKLFAQRTGGALICKATTASGSQYGLTSGVRVSMSVSGDKASIYAYGTGSVTISSPYGTDIYNVTAGQTIKKTLRGTGGSSVPAPVADFFAVPTEGWSAYVAPEFISTSTGWITDYLWEFGDGDWSEEPTPHHKYPQGGLYTVRLTVAGPGGEDSMTKTQYINLRDSSTYSWPDYILTSPSFASFTSALESIEASQTLYYTEKPEWCHNGSWTPWCDVVSTLQGHGGGGRILFGFSNTTIYGNWDGRIDPIKTWGDSNNKYDFIGDNLIIDGQDKNVGFYYNGTLDCGQAENQQAFRIHGCDNIVRNIRWERFPDGIHMRHGMRMLFEGITNMVICEDAVSTNGVGGSCVDCTSRNCTFGASEDKTFMNSTADGRRGLAPSRLVISGMYSVGGNQPIRVTGQADSLTVVRNSTFLGNSQGPRFGGENSLVLFENNYSNVDKNGVGGIRLGDRQCAYLRGNTFENSVGAYGVLVFATGAYIRAENNIIRNNAAGGIMIETAAVADCNVDFGGGLVDVYANSGLTGIGVTPASSIGRNTIKSNTGYDLINQMTAGIVKAENNFWDHTDPASILSIDVSGAADVTPVGTP